MKKTLVLASLLAAFGAASAQSSVTLYGKLDTVYGQSQDSSTTLAGVTTTKKSSGVMAGGNSSRWGIRGSEALGNGLKANFVIESGFNSAEGTGFGGTNASGAGSCATTATTNAGVVGACSLTNVSNNGLFARRATVGLSGNFGSVDFGRHLIPTIFVTGNHDADGLNTLSTSTHALDRIGQYRRSNAITFSSANYSGVTFMGQYAGNKGTSGTTSTPGADSGMGFNVQYAGGPLSLGLGYDVAKAYATTAGVAAAGSYKATGVTFGGAYNFGVAKLFANYGTTKVADAATGNTGTSNQFKQLNVSVAVPFGAATVLAGIGTNRVTVSNLTGQGKGTDVMVGLNYSLSPRTTIEARVGTVNKFSDNTTTGVSFLPTNVATKTTKATVGIHHNF